MLFFSVIIFIFGLVTGSFLNSVIYRLQAKKSFFSRSECPQCKTKLGFFDLIPIISFVFLRGRCRYCGKKISLVYLAVEITTALLFLVFLNFQFQSVFQLFNFKNLLAFFYLLFIFCCLIIIFVYDLKYSLILDRVVYFAGVVSLIFILVLFFLNKNFARLPNLLWGAMIGGGFFLILYLLSRARWIGAGDVKFGFLMGLWLSFPKILVALFLSFAIGAVISVIFVILGKKKMKSQISFGPFLVLGTLVALFWGDRILNWYMTWLGF